MCSSCTQLFCCLVNSGVSNISTLSPLYINTFTKHICDFIHNPRYLPFADDLKRYSTIINAYDCKLLPHDVN
jgi:hypothetical protein